jgi:DNA-binding LytR/AlgR family response regulator
METGINILIVEDEGILAMDLSDQLEDDGYQVVGVASNGRKAIDLFRQHSVDLVLCDINIKGEIDGIQTIQALCEIHPVPVIYLTAQTDRETILRAKQTYPAAYITKPFEATALRLAIEMALNNFSLRVLAPRPLEPSATVLPLNRGTDTNEARQSRSEPFLKLDDKLFIKQNYQFVKVPLRDVLYLEADDIHTTVVTSSKKYVIRLAMGTILERLQYNRLARIHRSFVVNMDQIDSFSDCEVIIGGQSLPLGRSYKSDFMQHFPFC